MDELDRLSLDFASRHPDSFARVLADAEVDAIKRIVDGLPAARKAVIVARLSEFQIKQLMDSEGQRPADWLADASFDDAVTLLSRIPREQRLELINSVGNPDRRRQLLRHHHYPAHNVGALVSAIPLRFAAELPVKDALGALRSADEPRGPVVVVDADGLYLGVLDGWRLLARNPSTGQVKDYLVEVKPIRPETPVIAAAMNEEWNWRNWLPVVDYRNRILGAVSRARIVRAADTHSASVPGRGDVVLDLLADLAYLCEAVLFQIIARRGTP